MIVVEACAAALITIALGMMIEADTRDMRVRVQRTATPGDTCR